MSIKESITSKLKTISDNTPLVYEAGKAVGRKEGEKAEYDRFWDAYQNGGTPRQYHYSFAGYGWTDETFRPKHDIVMIKGSNINAFQYCEVTDLAKSLSDCGVCLDTSQATVLTAAFAYAKTATLPVIDFTSAKNAVGNLFLSCKNLERIEKLIVAETNTFSKVFDGCEKLKHLVIEGVIASDMDLHWSPLSKASILSVLGALSKETDENGDYVVSGKTLALSQAAVDAAFESAEGAGDGSLTEAWFFAQLGPSDNWTITLE